MELVKGIDISHWNGKVDFAAIKKAGIKFVISKATEGTSSTDSYFSTNWNEAKAHGLIRGAYHFFHPNLNAAAQFEHYKKVVGTIDKTDFAPILDFETTDGLNAHDCVNHGADWMNAAKAFYGRTPIFYSYLSFIRDNLKNPTYYGSFPLWLAAYAKMPPVCPAPWPHYAIWQYSESGVCPGVPGHCDMNYFFGTEDELLNFIEKT